jgi:hypothetical protein
MIKMTRTVRMSFGRLQPCDDVISTHFRVSMIMVIASLDETILDEASTSNESIRDVKLKYELH